MRVILIICEWEKYPLVNVCELESSMSPTHLEKAVRTQKVNSKLFPRPFTEMSSRWSWDDDFTDNPFWIQRKRIRLWSHQFASGKKSILTVKPEGHTFDSYYENSIFFLWAACVTDWNIVFLMYSPGSKFTFTSLSWHRFDKTWKASKHAKKQP